MILGQILTSNKNLKINDFIRVTSNKDEIDSGLPTLVIGKKKIYELIDASKIKYLDRRINDKLYWTFAKNERRDEYEKDLERFYNLLIYNISRKVTYEYLNLFYCGLEKIKNLISLLRDKTVTKTIFVYREIVYIYCDYKVQAFSLVDIDYLGIERKKIFKKIYGFPNTVIMKKDDLLSNDLRKMTKDSVFLTPYLFFLEKN